MTPAVSQITTAGPSAFRSLFAQRWPSKSLKATSAGTCCRLSLLYALSPWKQLPTVSLKMRVAKGSCSRYMRYPKLGVYMFMLSYRNPFKAVCLPLSVLNKWIVTEMCGHSINTWALGAEFWCPRRAMGAVRVRARRR